MSKKDKPQSKFAGIIRRSKEDVKKQKLDDLELEVSAKELAKDEARLRKEEEAQKSPEDQALDAALSQSKIQTDKKIARKKQMKQAGIFAGIGLLIYLIFLGFQPFKGTMDYGLCKVFLETQVQFPDHLRLSGAKEYKNKDFVRIWYRNVDAYGEYRLGRIQCDFKNDPNRGRILQSVKHEQNYKMINCTEPLCLNFDARQEPILVSQDVVEQFNLSIPAIRTYPPDLTYPARLPSAISDLDFNFDAFRRPIL